MKKILLLCVIAVITITSCSTPAENGAKHDKSFPNINVAIVNPTVANIKTFRYLVDNKILPNIDSFGIIGVYHVKQNYDFERSQKYIDENNLTVKLVKCENELSIKNIYAQNDCSNLFEEIFEQTKGVFFFGGPDIPAECFNEKTHLMSGITDPYRHFFELSFLFHLLGGNQNENHTALLESNPDYAVIGFCLGMQTMNCATGGTMIQDIPMEVYNISTVEDVLNMPDAQHKNYNSYFDYDDKLTGYNFHRIKPKGDNAISKIIDNSEPYVLSSHHQAVKETGKNLDIAAVSSDGKIIEALVHQKYKHVVGTQFHPEYTGLYDRDAVIKLKNDDDENQNFLSLYAGEKGENFHREYWKMIGEWLNYLKKQTSFASF
ncbi:MAG: gamma-glutamyl-gamma-aminobutyrate hydrolase family protein [Prevotellaceae bacterium]|jgi:putative glutamine amidotransferase|nr:gamma-glutamyl-gamma-aminobutyrate hydrolase family protein [Prevotellaceae bacterium]